MRLLRLLLPVFVLCCLPFVAARAGSDPYSVSGIVVDASASSATQAQTIAINSGRARAWTTLYRRLAKQEDWSRQPTLDDTTLQRLVRSYLVSNERRSTTRLPTASPGSPSEPLMRLTWTTPPETNCRCDILPLLKFCIPLKPLVYPVIRNRMSEVF